MSCQAAGPLGAQAANTVLSRLAQSTPAPLSQAFVGQCISLGRARGTVQLSRTDDTPVNLVVRRNELAASIKEAICKGTLWGIRREPAKPGSYVWLKEVASGQGRVRKILTSVKLGRCESTGSAIWRGHPVMLRSGG